jgi:cob(I)alamin adenosyltransferase
VKLYTRFGDGGLTRLPGGETVCKTDLRVRACGELDELGALFGVILASAPPAGPSVSPVLDPQIAEILRASQAVLLEVGAWVAAMGAASPHVLPEEMANDTRHLETSIDFMQGELPPLRNFILAGGSPAGSQLHLARTICRRAERAVVEVTREWRDRNGSAEVLAWINRLGDWLFAAARWTSHRDGQPETVWMPRKKSGG